MRGSSRKCCNKSVLVKRTGYIIFKPTSGDPLSYPGPGEGISVHLQRRKGTITFFLKSHSSSMDLLSLIRAFVGASQEKSLIMRMTPRDSTNDWVLASVLAIFFRWMDWDSLTAYMGRGTSAKLNPIPTNALEVRLDLLTQIFIEKINNSPFTQNSIKKCNR